jgi:hypothetical protein
MCLINIPISLHTKLATVVHLAEGHFLCATKKQSEVSNVMNNNNKNRMLKYWYSDQIT